MWSVQPPYSALQCQRTTGVKMDREGKLKQAICMRILYGLVCRACYVTPDIEFVTNFIHIGFWLRNFTPQTNVKYVCIHFKNIVIVKKLYRSLWFYPKFIKYTHFTTGFTPVYVFCNQTIYQKQHNKATESESATKRKCSQANFTPVNSNFTWIISMYPWQIPCLRDTWKSMFVIWQLLCGFLWI